MLRQLAVFLLIGAATAPAFAQNAKKQTPFRVYFIGNSVTDTINYRALAELAKSRGHNHVWGRHMIPGAPLQWIWQHPKDGFQEQPFGHYPNALANFQWDVLSLQPFDRHLDGKDGDILMARNFIDLALPQSPDLQVYVYARWPRQGKDDFDTVWQKKYTGGWDNTNETKDYFERLTLELRKAYPKLKKPILMVPVGHVMYDLNQQMKSGQVPGYKHIKEVFADGIHLNNVGSYIVGCTFFATLYRENPKGLSGEPYKVADKKLAEVIQETVWKVVSTHELAGVATTTVSGFYTTTKKPADRVEAETRDDTTTLTITSLSGIGGATISPNNGQWPKKVILRLQLKGLESLTISNGKVTLGASVSSHGDQGQRLFLKDDSQETPVGKDDPKWMEIKMVGGEKVPLKDGYFELVLPQALLKESKALTISWIDFYRG